jgi:hypothetical protein
MAIVVRRPVGWPLALIAETVPFPAVAKIYAAGASQHVVSPPCKALNVSVLEGKTSQAIVCA